jgi:hypothetical protein
METAAQGKTLPASRKNFTFPVLLLPEGSSLLSDVGKIRHSSLSPCGNIAAYFEN